MVPDSILFDLDGTLWDAVDGILLTWNRVIAQHPGLRPPILRPEQEALMGLPMDEIARRLFPSESADRQQALMAACIAEENAYLRHHGGTLYPEVPQTLSRLHQRYKLYIVSNCQSGYIEAFLHAHRLQSCFDGALCFGDTGQSKGANIRQLSARYSLRAPVYVGDTQGDLDAATQAGIPFVFAAYGFGSVPPGQIQIQRFSQLLDLFPSEGT